MNVRIVVLMCVLVATAPAGATLSAQSIEVSDPQTGYWLLGFDDGTEYEIQRPWSWEDYELTDDLPSHLTEHLPSNTLRGETEVTVTPTVPTTDDVLEVTVSLDWPAILTLAETNLDIQGRQITLDLKWVTGAMQRLAVGPTYMVHTTHTTSFGPLGAGFYSLRVNNSGAVTSTVIKTIAVRGTVLQMPSSFSYLRNALLPFGN